MKVKDLLLISALAGLIVGLGFLLIPATMLQIYGIETDAVGLLMGRFFGGAIIGHGILCWTARNIQADDLRKHVLPAVTIAYLIGLALILIGQFSDMFNVFGWVSAGIFVLLSLAFGYFLFFPQQTK